MKGKEKLRVAIERLNGIQFGEIRIFASYLKIKILKRGRFEKLLGFARSHYHIPPALLNLNGIKIRNDRVFSLKIKSDTIT